MKKIVSISRYSLAVVMLILCATCSSTAPDPDEWSPGLLLDWNETIFDIAVAEDGLSTLKGLRTAAMLRVYLGIHFRYDSEAGFELGRRVGEYAGTKILQPIQ